MTYSSEPAELVYRLGGEEFLVLLPGHDAASAAEQVERIRHRIGDEVVADLHVTLSAGEATATGDAVRLERLLAEADAALYEAKRSGRDRDRDRVSLSALPQQPELRDELPSAG